jgi:hypothetical protein
MMLLRLLDAELARCAGGSDDGCRTTSGIARRVVRPRARQGRQRALATACRHHNGSTGGLR